MNIIHVSIEKYKFIIIYYTLMIRLLQSYLVDKFL